MTQSIHSHQFENGLVLLAESMDWLESASFSIQLPAGYAYDPDQRQGLANFACDMVQRGCGERDSRQFVEDLDRLGTDRSASVSAAHTSFGAATLASNLPTTLSIYADLIRRPQLPADQLDEGRMVCLQEIAAAEDDLAHRTLVQLRKLRYGTPWGRTSTGTAESVERVTLDDVTHHVSTYYRPQGMILSVAGKVDWQELQATVGELFGDWQVTDPAPFAETPAGGGYDHIEHESHQIQIGVGYASVPYADANYFQARGAVGILSDGMSSRLFTEVREKRGLCYTVYAICHSLRDRGSVLCYAATSTENAQQTLDVLMEELKRLPDGVQDDELRRLKARIKSSLIMQQESSAARSVAMSNDWYHLGRVYRMDELGAIIDRLSCDSINDYLRQHPPDDFCVVTLGGKQLNLR